MTRRGLVLGGGAILGFAWEVGALRALEERIGIAAQEFDMIVGVSAGAIMGALVSCGVSTDVLLRHQRGEPAPADIALDYDYHALDGSNGKPPRPDWGVGSPSLLARAARRPGALPPMAIISAALPVGKGSLDPVQRVIAQVCPQGWAPHPSLWVVAMDYATGTRAVFGRPGSPKADLATAVGASCAIPSWFTPVEIEGKRYVDGGMFSNTSTDLLAGQGLDEVYVIAPMVSFAMDSPDGMMAKLERRWRRSVTRRCEREAIKVRASGADVTIIGPSVEDLRAMGPNLMDVARKNQVLETSLRTSSAALRLAGV
ncbi:MAG: patatin-like phospholipase family protein [Corynebacteriales bacterium]|nr:patatin-like phospholipase family protein [Mycobacteriales bacterium]